MLSSLAAVRTGTSFSMLTSSGFRKEVNVGENWFRLNQVSKTPVEHPSLGENHEIIVQAGMKLKDGWAIRFSYNLILF